VYYRGFREGKGIWGTWEIGIFAHGGFHIWPKGEHDEEAMTAAAEASAPAESIGEDSEVWSARDFSVSVCKTSGCWSLAT